MTPNTLRRLQLLSGSHVLVTTGGGVSRLARLVSLAAGPCAGCANASDGARAACCSPNCQRSPSRPPGVAYLSPVLAFNLALALHLRPFLGAPRPHVYLEPVPSVSNVRAARVALVREPAEAAEMLNSGSQPPDTSEELDAALRLHFATPRLLTQGDVFSVPVAEGGGEEPRLSYFQLRSSEPRSGLLCDATTSLVLDGSTAAAAPPSCSLSGFHAALAQLPVSSHPAVAQLCSLASPLLHPSAAHLRLRLAVLLKGPVGVGKRGVAHSVARAMGMNIVVYNCHELAPGGGGCAPRTTPSRLQR